MWSLWVLPFHFLLPFISAQYNNPAPIQFQPIPIILKFPNSLPYSSNIVAGNEANYLERDLRRQDVPNQVIYEGQGLRNSRYSERLNSKHSERGWYTPPRSQKRLRQSRKDALSVHKNILREVERTPRVVKYIADQNGFALREDLVGTSQDTMSRSRRKPRILTSGSSPLVAKVVTSAIQVSNSNSGQIRSVGQYVPQVIDLRVGK